MKFDYYDRHEIPGQAKGRALSNLLSFATVWLLTTGGAILLITWHDLDILYILFSIIFNPVAWIIAGYKYLNNHGIYSTSGCLIVLMAPVRLVMALVIGIAYYPYLVICAVKKIIKG